MTEKKDTPSVNNSIQTRLSGVMLMVLVFALGINFFIFSQIQNAVTRIDAVFSSNVDVNELSEALELVENTVYEYLNTKSTETLENYYRYDQNYKNLIEDLNDKNMDSEVKMLEKNIRRMSESYLDQTNETVQAKRGRNVEKYKTSYETENQLYEYINTYIYKLNNLRFKTNSASPSSRRGSNSAVRIKVSGICERSSSRIGAKYGFCLSFGLLSYSLR